MTEIAAFACPVCERPFGSPDALRQHQRDAGHGAPDWPAVRRGRRRGGKRARPRTEAESRGADAP